MFLVETTAKGDQLDQDVNDLKAQLTQFKKERDAAVDARKALLQQLERDKAEYDAQEQEIGGTTVEVHIRDTWRPFRYNS